MSSPLQQIAEGVWVAPAPLRFLGVLQLGTRMTVMRVGGGLVVHSAVPLDDALKSAVDALGSVHSVVAPSLFHHLYAGHAAAAWSGARLFGPAKLKAKRKDLRIDGELEAGEPAEWGGELEAVTIRGSMLCETVLYHRPSRTIVSSDLFEGFTKVDHGLTRAYLKLNGVYGKHGWPALLRLAYRDRKAARESVEQLLDRAADRIVIAHGDIVTSQPRETLRNALQFLFV